MKTKADTNSGTSARLKSKGRVHVVQWKDVQLSVNCIKKSMWIWVELSANWWAYWLLFLLINISTDMRLMKLIVILPFHIIKDINSQERWRDLVCAGAVWRQTNSSSSTQLTADAQRIVIILSGWLCQPWETERKRLSTRVKQPINQSSDHLIRWPSNCRVSTV